MDVPHKEINQLSESMEHRWAALKNKFKESYTTDCTAFICAPGRVNLIGEHIDYNGYGVMPIATSLNVIIAASAREDHVLHMCNIDSNYPDYKIDINNISIESEKHAWYKYILCGIKGLMDERCDFKPTGMSLAVSGNIPPGCGLSSSSALVCGAALAAVRLYGLKIDKIDLAKMCARFERLIGTEGGGMDQAASFLSKEGYANFIEFSPLRSTPVQLPPGCNFVVSNSLVEKVKALGSDFNQRVMECRLSSFILAKNAGLEWEKFTKLADLQTTLKKNYTEMVELVNRFIRKDPYTQMDLCSALDISQMKLHQVISANTKHIPTFHLHNRVMHVFSEAERIYQFNIVCQTLAREPQQSKVEERVVQLGKLMYASHASLKDLYECSHEKLDRLVNISRGVAYGARLTGAGWGGCVVALVAEEKVETYMNLLKMEFYANEIDSSTVIFSSLPAGGACTYNI